MILRIADIMRMEIGPIHGICLDCRRWLHEPNRLQMCGACHEKYDKAMKEFAELLLATHKLKEGRT